MCWDWWFKSESKEKPKKVDPIHTKWKLSYDEVIEKYGTPRNAMIELFQDLPNVNGKSADVVKLIYAYLREEYYRKNPQ